MSTSHKVDETGLYPRIEAIREFLKSQSFTPVPDRAELKRIMDTSRQINLDEGARQDDEKDALQALFVELGIPPGDLMREATDLYIESRYGQFLDKPKHG